MATRIDQLTKLASLRERGLITPDEFEREKARLLAAPDTTGEERLDPAPTAGAPGEVMPDSNILWAVLTTVFCFLPFGIVALVKSSQVATLWHSGQRKAAREAAESAGAWSIAAVGVGVLLMVVVLFIETKL